MLKGNEGPEMRCQRCGNSIWPRCGAYWFLVLGPRGRCKFPGVTEARGIFCSACGRVLREYLESSGFTGEAYESERSCDGARVPVGGRGCAV